MAEGTALHDAEHICALSTISQLGEDDSLPARIGTSSEAYPEAAINELLQYLGRAVPCFVSGALLMQEGYGRVFLVCLHPVDTFFLLAVQQRMLRGYRLCIGPAQTIYGLDVTVEGEPVRGPYEPPRSFLSVPILADDGRAFGMLAIASVFRDAFGGKDLCTLSIVAAQAATLLTRLRSPVADDRDAGVHSPSPASEQRRCLHYHRLVDRYLSSVLGTVTLWKSRSDAEIPDALRHDLETIARDVVHLRTLLARLHA